MSVATNENGALTGDLDWDDRENFLQRQFGAKWPRKLGNQKLYVVFWFDVGQEAGCDLRCH